MNDVVEFARAVRPARAEEATRLRAEVRSWLDGLAIDQEARERVLAAVSEAVDNAVEHAYSPDAGGTVELTLWSEQDAINVSVVDHGVWHDGTPPAPQGSLAPRGRGLVIMHRSVDSVAVRHGHDGTVVDLRHHRVDTPAG